MHVISNLQDPSNCNHIPEVAKMIRNIFQSYIVSSHLPPYDKKTHKGFWRELTIRVYTTSEVMVILQVNAKEYPDDFVTEKKNIVDLISKLAGERNQETPLIKRSDKTVTSLFIQNNTGLFDFSESPYELLLGNPYVHENLLGLKFRISPAAFFQGIHAY